MAVIILLQCFTVSSVRRMFFVLNAKGFDDSFKGSYHPLMNSSIKGSGHIVSGQNL